MHLIPQSWSHLHILVSVFPSVGLIFALGFYVTAMIVNNEAMKRTGLVAFGLLGTLAIPAYLSADGSADALAQNPKFTEDMVSAHLGWGVTAVAMLATPGLAAWIALWRFRRPARLADHAP